MPISAIPTPRDRRARRAERAGVVAAGGQVVAVDDVAGDQAVAHPAVRLSLVGLVEQHQPDRVAVADVAQHPHPAGVVDEHAERVGEGLVALDAAPRLGRRN